MVLFLLYKVPKNPNSYNDKKQTSVYLGLGWDGASGGLGYMVVIVL